MGRILFNQLLKLNVMKRQLLMKVFQFIVFATAFFTLSESANAQKKCKNGRCPSGYICAPSGLCIRYCSRCQSVFIKSNNELVSGESSKLTVIRFQMNEAKIGDLNIYDLTGRLIRTISEESIQDGVHQFLWNAKDESGNTVPTGVYIFQLNAGDKTETRKLYVVS
jgi:hypothetical protein